MQDGTDVGWGGSTRRSGHHSPLYSPAMSGHSKWSTIKRQKGVTDVKRGRRLHEGRPGDRGGGARQGGGDPDANYRLRLAIEKARAVNMPADNIKRAIDKAAGGGEGEQFEEIVYEGYGPGGVAILVEAATDNRNRTAAEVRSIFAKAGGQLAGSGAVAWQFEPRGLITAVGADPDAIALAAIDAGASDVDTTVDPIEIYTEPADLEAVRTALEQAGVKVESGRVGDGRQADRRARPGQGPPGPPPGRPARGPRRRPARHRQLRHPGGGLRRGRRMIVLGIDPGRRRWAMASWSGPAGRLRSVDYGCVVTSPDRSLAAIG